MGAKRLDILAAVSNRVSDHVWLSAVRVGVGLGILAGEGMAMLAVKIVKIVPRMARRYFLAVGPNFGIIFGDNRHLVWSVSSTKGIIAFSY